MHTTKSPFAAKLLTFFTRLAFCVVVCALPMGSVTAQTSSQTSSSHDWPNVPTGPFHWQLQGDIKLGSDIKIVGSDAFDTTADQVRAWRDAGIFPICYVNVGAVEDWRSDRNQFPPDSIGNAYWGWPGEYWLNIRRFERFSDVILARFDLCRDKGFLAIEPDNIDAYEADETNKETGFDLSRKDQLLYVNWLIEQAHARGLAIGQKNAPDLVPELVDKMDFALLESAYRLGFMEDFEPYAEMNKPVFAVEYLDEMEVGNDPQSLCPAAKELGFQGVIAHLDLDRAPQNCP